MHRHGYAAVRLTSSNRFARFPTEWQTLVLMSREFKRAIWSLCKSPNLHITGCNYYTVAASPRWDSYGATIDIVEKAVAASKLRSEENRAALLLPQSKYKPLSLCKSPNVHITGCNYYTVTATPRWDWLRRTASLGFLRSDKGQFSTKRF